jgi:hypothetical protein
LALLRFDLGRLALDGALIIEQSASHLLGQRPRVSPPLLREALLEWLLSAPPGHFRVPGRIAASQDAYRSLSGFRAALTVNSAFALSTSRLHTSYFPS